MKRVLCPQLPQRGRLVELSEAEAQHVVKVFRLRDGEKIEAIDGRGGAAVTVLRIRGETAFLEFFEKSASADAEQTIPLTLEMAVLKGEAMEWVIEKCVELGVESVVPVLTAHTVVQMKRKGPEEFQTRWQRIADQALKQCGRLTSLRVELPRELANVLADTASARLWCDEGARGEAPHLSKWLAGEKFETLRVLIGPEGGWSLEEREMIMRASAAPTHAVSLGPLVLRAETAAVVAVGLVSGAVWGR